MTGQPTRGRVLVVDDDRDLCALLALQLGRRGFHVTWRTTPAEALEVARSADLDAVLTDLQMDGMHGLELCERIVAVRPDVPVAVLTAFGSLETAVSAIRAGAYDFITKPPDVDALEHTLGRAVAQRRLREELRRLPVAGEMRRFGELLGNSAAMQRVFDLLQRVVDSDASVLVTGESGTGKELVARALHRHGRRGNAPFVAVNCAAVPEALLESELFGHVRGAFTDARNTRPGLFAQAHGGTLFLDEIGDLPLPLQPKLLRAIQEKRIRPVGSDAEVACDVRVVASTNRDLDAAVAEHRFREDLFFRINVIPLPLPALRDRGHDILLLAQHFLDRCRAQGGTRVVGISAAAARRLLAYAWPGNVRELQNCVERAAVLARYDHLTVDDLPERVGSYRPSSALLGPDGPPGLLPLAEVERRHILRVLELVRGNKTLAAQALGLDRKTLRRKLARGTGESEVER
ncbi:MAG: sigma-54-dependent Fis family transcriptional regulator [bacterium]|nr:sigma-54-dependent Fis family transcriptional regulator [bacterium]